MPSARSARLLAVLLCSLCLVLVAEGRIFKRSGSASELTLQLGWERAYQTTMQINRGRAEVEVLSSRRPLSLTLAKLAAYYEKIGSSSVFFPGENMAWGMAVHRGLVSRFLLVAHREHNNTLVYKIDQEENQFHRSRPEQRDHLLEQVPDYPGAEPGYYNYDEGTRTAMEISRSRSEPAQILATLDDKLRGEGWKPGARSGGMKIYMKGRDVVYLGVHSSEAGRDSVITRVYKRGGAAD